MVYRLLQTRSDCRRARLYSGCTSSDMGLVFDYYEYDFSPSKTFCVSMLDYCTYCLARRFLHYSDHATDRHLFPPYHSLPHLHIHQPNPMSSPPPANFHKTELHRALTEQTTSISHFHLIDPDPDSARTSCDAEVRTLEGKTVCITLSSRGYSVKSDEEEQEVFETIEGLLGTISPAYTKDRQQALVEALNKLL